MMGWQDWTIKSWDLDTEHTHVLYSPVDKKIEKAAGGSVEVHLALTPLRPWLFFGAHRRLSVNGKFKHMMVHCWILEV
jgi:hypothetical protein